MSKPAIARLHTDHAGTGSPVLLTHGLGDTASTWDHVVPALALDHRVTCWDLRGHGRSEAPSDPARYSRDIAIADLLRMVDEVAPPITLVGHSLGGYLSLAVALRHPELVRGLVMISSGPGFRDPDARAGWNRFVDEAAQRMPIPAQASRLCHQPDTWVIDELPSLGCPLVQIVGGDDHRFHDGVAYIQRALPHSTAVTIHGAGHHPQRTHADQVVEAIEQVLD
jgi:pimeloyl-ACP methyl ester carboxylesterase